tara:strand:- start:970 stop:1620 length:651 start_codon:yes stop_codon:yes gene_type:complete
MMTAVVAVRAGSQRVKNKNLQDLGGVTLLERKLYNLLEVQIKGYIDNIIVNSDSDEMLEIAKDLTVDTHKREEYYASSECTNSEFHRHIGEVTESEDIFLAPVCSPFVSIESHIDAIKLYKEEGYDSLTSVTEVKNHLWMDGHPLNYDLDNVPNSQDLPDVVKLNYGITIAKREVMKNLGRVVGNNPGFLKINEKESIDIDTPFDLQVARGIINER